MTYRPECIMCDKIARYQCPRCNKPLCYRHGTPRPAQKKGQADYTPGQDCVAQRVEES